MNNIAESLRACTENGADPEVLFCAADEIDKLRAENASLKEVISLSEDSRLMDEYLKLERANARQAERIAELEAQLVIEKGQLDLRDEENRILFAKSKAQSAVIEKAKSVVRKNLKFFQDARLDGLAASAEADLAAIAELEKGVG